MVFLEKDGDRYTITAMNVGQIDSRIFPSWTQSLSWNAKVCRVCALHDKENSLIRSSLWADVKELESQHKNEKNL